jgi:hypothetical protein
MVVNGECAEAVVTAIDLEEAEWYHTDPHREVQKHFLLPSSI